jgi:hypothetical protein
MGNGDETMNTMENGWKRCMWIYLEKWMFNLRWFNHPELWRWYLEYNLSYHFYPLVNWHQSVHRSSSSQLGIPRIGTSTMPKLMKNERWFRVSCSTCSKQTAFSLLKTMGMHRYHSLSGLVLHHLGSSHVLDWSQNVWSFWVKLSLDLFFKWFSHGCNQVRRLLLVLAPHVDYQKLRFPSYIYTYIYINLHCSNQTWQRVIP